LPIDVLVVFSFPPAELDVIVLVFVLLDVNVAHAKVFPARSIVPDVSVKTPPEEISTSSTSSSVAPALATVIFLGISSPPLVMYCVPELAPNVSVAPWLVHVLPVSTVRSPYSVNELLANAPVVPVRFRDLIRELAVTVIAPLPALTDMLIDRASFPPLVDPHVNVLEDAVLVLAFRMTSSVFVKFVSVAPLNIVPVPVR